MHFAACVDVEQEQTKRSGRVPLAPAHYYRSSLSCGVIAFLKTLCLQSHGKVPGQAGHTWSSKCMDLKLLPRPRHAKQSFVFLMVHYSAAQGSRGPVTTECTLDGSTAGGGPSEGCTAHISFRLFSF